MLEEPSLLILLIVLVFLLILSGFFSGSETGMMASNKVKLKNLSKKGNKGAARALELLQRPDKLLSAILVGNNFANILASAIVTILMIDYFNGSVLLGSIILTIIVLIFSEITPKTIAAIKSEEFAIKSSWLLKIFGSIFSPIIVIINSISSRILRLVKLDIKKSQANDNLNTQELRTLLEESGDLIPYQFKEMLSSILGMEELVVEDIMTPNAEVIGIDINDSFENAKNIIESSSYSLLPVYKGTIDGIQGILHLKDSHSFLNLLQENKDLKDSLLETYFVSQSTTLIKQLSEFQKLDRNVGMVVDEYGEIEGLITLDDIFVEIVGRFGNEKVEFEKEFVKRKDGSIVTDGNCKIRDLNKYANWFLPEANSKTINGLLTEYIDQIPQANVCVEIKNYRFEILEIEDNQISQVKVIKYS
ncbi:MAG: HlyC/CorC family transporter [Gammaproteobacteria bacterium]|tara:strand:- start:1389 stop:2645 length:1257 start_codon:yes stop_codon:yes gene_type:complete